MTVRYNDWQVTQWHATAIRDLEPAGVSSLEVRRQIPGVVRGRVIDGFRSGFYIMPLSSKIATTYSGTVDIDRNSLLVSATGLSTASSASTPKMITLLESIREKFSHNRILGQVGELYSYMPDEPNYDIDDAIARKFDIIMAVLTTRFRESRVNAA